MTSGRIHRTQMPTIAPKKYWQNQLTEPVNPMPACKKCHSGIRKCRNAN
jgi:hypothetical protein